MWGLCVTESSRPQGSRVEWSHQERRQCPRDQRAGALPAATREPEGLVGMVPVVPTSPRTQGAISVSCQHELLPIRVSPWELGRKCRFWAPDLLTWSSESGRRRQRSRALWVLMLVTVKTLPRRTLGSCPPTVSDLAGPTAGLACHFLVASGSEERGADSGFAAVVRLQCPPWAPLAPVSASPSPCTLSTHTPEVSWPQNE